MTERGRIGPDEILELLAHRYPFLLVDRFAEHEPGKRAVAVKQVTGNEWFAPGLPPDDPALGGMPPTLVLEALAQTTAAVLVGMADSPPGAIAYFMGMNRVRLRGPARPGETIRLEVVLVSFRRGICRVRGTATVAGRRIAGAELMIVLRAGR